MSSVEQLAKVVLHNWPLKIASFLIAVMLWAAVLGSRYVEDILEVPVEIITAPEMIVANEVPARIAFKISGPQAFLKTIKGRREEPIRINLAHEKSGIIPYSISPDSVRVPIGGKILSITPASMTIRLEPLRRKEVPIKIDLLGVPPDGMKYRALLVPNTAKIRGPDSRMLPISEVSTFPIDLSQIRHSTERLNITLDIARLGVTLESPAPKLILEIEPPAANYRIKNVDIRVMTSYKFRLEQKKATVYVRTADGEPNAAKQAIYGIVDLRDKPPGDYVETVKFNLPAGLIFVKAVPDRVHVRLFQEK